MPGSKSLNWQDKVKIQEIVDDLEFVNYVKEEKYKCVRCNKLALYHCLAECSHMYCGECQENINEMQCVYEGCGQVVSKIKHDKQVDEEIAELIVFCPFKKNGCKEEITLRNYWEHERTCRLSSRYLLPKIYKTDRVIELQLETEELKNEIVDLRNKNRLLDYKLVDFKSQQGILLIEIQNDHKNFKKMVALQMEKIELKNKSKREELNNSIKDLQTANKLLGDELELFKREYNLLSSKIQADQKHMEEALPVHMEKIALENEGRISNLKKETHDMMVKCDENLMTLRGEVKNEMEKYVKEQTEETKVFVKELDLKLGCLSDADMGNTFTEFSWEVKEIGQLISHRFSEGIVVFSNTFNMRGIELQIKIELVSCNNDVCIACTFQQMHNFVPQQPLYFKQNICILDQSVTGAKRHNYRKSFPSFKDKADQEGRYLFDRTTNFFIPKKLFDEKSHPYVKGNTAIIHFLLEPICFSYNVYFSKNGRLLWKIDNYVKKRQMGIEGINTVLYSEYFYSGEPGYRSVLEAKFHLNSVIFGLRYVKGKYDNFLPTQFPHRATLRILDQSQTHDGKHLIRTCDCEEARYDKFIEINHKDIENAIYLKEESILVEAIVGPKKTIRYTWT